MRINLERGDQRLLIGGGIALLLIVTATAYLSPPEDAPVFFPSSYSAASGGAKAAYLLLEEMGYNVERWSYSPQELPHPNRGDTLVLANPFMGASQAERDAIIAWLEGGGRLLLTGSVGANFLPQRHLENAKADFFESRVYSAAAPSPLNRGAQQVKLKAEAFWKSSEAPAVVAFGDDEHAAAVSFPYGAGEVIWWAGATPLTNAGLKDAGNLELLLNSLGAIAGQRILWDEYFHGERRSLASYVARTPLFWGLGQAALLMLLLMAGFSRRSGPVRSLAPEPRLSPLEFVDSLGGLYQRARAGSAAVQVAHQRFRYLLIKRLGLPSNASTRELTTAVRDRLGWKEPGLNQLLYRCESAARDPELRDDDALGMVQGLQHYTQLLRLSSRSVSQKEKSRWKQ
jgi:hypothetical protein